MNVAALPWPNKLLSPNARVHHLVKHKAVRSHRGLAAVIGAQHGRKRLRIPVLAVLPIVTTRRRRDIDNVLAGLKSALDGLTDCGWWEDDSEVVGITIRKPLHIRAWSIDPIVIVADEESNEDVMLTRLRNFAVHALEDHERAWSELCKHRPQ